MNSILLLAFAAPLLSEPATVNPLLAASNWLEGTLLGAVATAVAVIAVALQGLLLLTGRLQARRGLTLLAGCFLLFGAGTISSGLRSVLGDGDRGREEAAVAPPPPPPLPPVTVAPPPTPMPPSRPYDPYAGAAVPGQH